MAIDYSQKIPNNVVPPGDEVRLPLLERALQRAVVGEVDVVGNLLGVVDGHGDVSMKKGGVRRA